MVSYTYILMNEISQFLMDSKCNSWENGKKPYFFSLEKSGSMSKNCADQYLVKLWDLQVQNILYLGL